MFPRGSIGAVSSVRSSIRFLFILGLDSTVRNPHSLPMSGPQLKAQRLLSSVKASDLAVRLGVGRTRIPQIEGQAAVSDELVSRYLAALIELAAEARVST